MHDKECKVSQNRKQRVKNTSVEFAISFNDILYKENCNFYFILQLRSTS